MGAVKSIQCCGNRTNYLQYNEEEEDEKLRKMLAAASAPEDSNRAEAHQGSSSSSYRGSEDQAAQPAGPTEGDEDLRKLVGEPDKVGARRGTASSPGTGLRAAEAKLSAPSELPRPASTGGTAEALSAPAATKPPPSHQVPATENRQASLDFLSTPAAGVKAPASASAVSKVSEAQPAASAASFDAFTDAVQAARSKAAALTASAPVTIAQPAAVPAALSSQDPEAGGTAAATSPMSSEEALGSPQRRSPKAGAKAKSPFQPGLVPAAQTAGSAVPEAAPSRSPKAKQPNSEPKLQWVVLGGTDPRGILVRSGQGLKSLELGRLGKGAVIEEQERLSDRLRYKKLQGDGPDKGWVSMTVTGKAMLARKEA